MKQGIYLTILSKTVQQFGREALCMQLKLQSYGMCSFYLSQFVFWGLWRGVFSLPNHFSPFPAADAVAMLPFSVQNNAGHFGHTCAHRHIHTWYCQPHTVKNCGSGMKKIMKCSKIINFDFYLAPGFWALAGRGDRVTFSTFFSATTTRNLFNNNNKKLRFSQIHMTPRIGVLRKIPAIARLMKIMTVGNNESWQSWELAQTVLPLM